MLKTKDPPNPIKQFSSIKWYVGKPSKNSVSTYEMVNVL